MIPFATTGWSVDAADHHLQRSLWEAILAAKLARVVDRLLDDPVFIQPFRVHFDTRLAGGMPDGASRLISLHDPDVGPLRKGRIGPPVEFGYKAQVLDNPDGIVLEHQVMVGNPPDAPLLAPAVRRVIARTGNVPRAVTADRGYGEARVDQELADLGVVRAVTPRRGRASPVRQLVERQRGFRRLVSGAPAARAGSAASSTASAGTAPGWTASKAPASAAATACSPTTSSRSAGCWKAHNTRQHEHPNTRTSNHDHLKSEAGRPHRQASFWSNNLV